MNKLQERKNNFITIEATRSGVALAYVSVIISCTSTTQNRHSRECILTSVNYILCNLLFYLCTVYSLA